MSGLCQSLKIRLRVWCCYIHCPNEETKTENLSTCQSLYISLVLSMNLDWSMCYSAVYQVALVVNNLSANAGRCRRQAFAPWVGKISWRRAWQPTPVFLPGEFHGKRSVVGCSPWGHKESDMTDTTECESVFKDQISKIDFQEL